MGFNFTDISCIYNVFSDIGTCESLRVSSKQLSQYYLVWYKPNGEGNNGPHVKGSLNYLFHEYATKTLNGTTNMLERIQHLVQSFKENDV
jgi:hypothetical protein